MVKRLTNRSVLCEERFPKRRKPAGGLGSFFGVAATFSLANKGLWGQVSSAVLEDVAGYVQPKTYGTHAIAVPAGQLDRGVICTAHGDEVFVGGGKQLAVYRDSALQRRIGDAGSRLYGCAVMGATLYVAAHGVDYVEGYPLAGGVRERRFGAECGADELRGWGVAAHSGHVFVTQLDANRVNVFTADGRLAAQSGDGQLSAPRGIAIADGQVFVADQNHSSIAVFSTGELSLERRIGDANLAYPMGVCTADGLLFVSDSPNHLQRVVVFDASDGHFVVCMRGFGGAPYGVTVGADCTLRIAVVNSMSQWSLHTVAPL